MQPSEVLVLRIPNSTRNTICSDAKGCYKAPGRCNPNSLIEEKVKRKGIQCCTRLLTDICRPRQYLSIAQVQAIPWKSMKRNDGPKKENFVGSLSLCAWFIYCTRVQTYPYNISGKKKIISACCCVHDALTAPVSNLL